MVSTRIRSGDSVPRRTNGPLPAWRKRAWLFVAGTVVTGVAALALAMWLGGNLSVSLINTMVVGARGDLTGWGLSASKLVMDVSAIGVIGMLLVCLLLPGDRRELGATARRCLRTASRLSLMWAVSQAVLLIFDWSYDVGLPVTALPWSKLVTNPVNTVPEASTFLTIGALALVIAAATSITRTRRGALVLLALSISNFLPMALVGHPGDSAGEQYGLAVHVIAMPLWAGGLAALLIHVRRKPTLLAVAVPRFSALALGCYAAVAISGLFVAWEMLDYSVPALWESRYGVLVSLKAMALIALGIFGWWHRRHTVPLIRSGEGGRARRAFIRLAAAEVAVMVAAIAVAVVMWRTASPDMLLDYSYRNQQPRYQHLIPLGTP